MNFPEKLRRKIALRINENSLRKLGETHNMIDFCSNDYLGFAISKELKNKTQHFLDDNKVIQNGATGSRLISGNHNLYQVVEQELSLIHNVEATLIYNSGYNANLGLLSCIPQRNDIILYDEFIHASVRDGLQLSNAKSYKFNHNDILDLENKLKKLSNKKRGIDEEIYVITESVFSMDGDSPDIESMLTICEQYKAHFIIDEAHSLGVFGEKGLGKIQQLKLEQRIFARIITFGKSLGCHGAAILGSKELKQFLINYSRTFIYTTGLVPHSLAAIKSAYDFLLCDEGLIQKRRLQNNIHYFHKIVKKMNLNFIKSTSAIHCCIVSGNQKTKEIAKKLGENGFDVKPILSPTVTKGKERLRFCIHSYNTFQEIDKVLEKLVTFVHEY